MNAVEKIIDHLKAMPDSERNEVLDFVEYLKTSARRRKQSGIASRTPGAIRALSGFFWG
jgi:hypothetical protein